MLPRLRAAIPLLTALLAGFLLLAGETPGFAEVEPDAEHGAETPLDQAREESGLTEQPAARHRLPVGELEVLPSELLASVAGQPISFRLTLDRAVPSGTLELILPRDWVRTEPSGLRTARPPSLERRAGGAADLGRQGRRVVLSVDGAGAGDVASFELINIGIPAGTYSLPFSWRGGGESARGVAQVVIYAPSREGLPDPGVAENVTSDSNEESETFIAATPGNPNRVAVGVNWQSASMSAWISADAGHTWVQRTLPNTIDAPAKSSNENGDICCDPTFAADPLGNIWFGGLSLKKGNAPSRIVVNRIAAGTNSFRTLTVGLPFSVTGTQDKPMMTIDNSASSPTFGRLYVVWDQPASGGVNVVISQCDTRPGPSHLPNAANCDNADNWSAPARVTPTGGSYIYGDVAAGPDGRVYVTWWDYSSTNAIRGDVCNPSSANCAAASGWGTPQTIALLDSTGGNPVPFACPIVAQPGGRDAPTPQVEVDHSGGSENGRVYVTWSDLRPGSGTTRCATTQQFPDGTPPASTHLTWDSFVDSAASGALPGGLGTSSFVGTKLYTDSSEGGAITNSDEWFPWLAVDQTSGQAWADFYSTRDQAARQTTNFYARSVTPSGGGHTLGTLTRVSASPSDYSGKPCCSFGNDYGDYTGIDATGDVAYPVWSDNSTGDGEAFTFVAQLAPPSAPTVVTGAASSVGQTSATLNGTVNPNGQTTTYHFEYGSLGDCAVPSNNCTSTTGQNAGSGSGAQPVTAGLTGLTDGTTYHFRLVAQNATGTSAGSDHTFTTVTSSPGSPPDAITGSAAAVGQTTATLNGTVNPNGDDTNYHFEYGVDQGGSTVYTSTSTQGPISGTDDVPVQADLTGLTASTTYRYRLVASNSTPPATTGSQQTFKTASPPPPPPAPVATTGAAGPIGTFSATVGGTVNPNGLATTYHFDYGTTTAYGSSTPETSAGSDSLNHHVSAALTPLLPLTTYHYRLVATGGGQTVEGNDASFVSGPLDLTGPQIRIMGKRLRLSREGTGRVRLRCPASEPDPFCVGVLRLKSSRRVIFRGRNAKLKLGKAGFKVSAGSSRRITLHVSSAKLRLIESLGLIRVRAVARARDSAGNAGVARKRLRLVAVPA